MTKRKLRISVNSLPLLARPDVFSVDEIIEIVKDYFRPEKKIILTNHSSDSVKFSSLPQSLYREDVSEYLKSCDVSVICQLMNEIESIHLTTIFLTRPDIDLELQIKTALLKKVVTPLIKRTDVPIEKAFELLKIVPSSNGFTAFNERKDSAISQMIELCNSCEFYKIRISKIVTRKDFTPVMILDLLMKNPSLEVLDIALNRLDFCKHLMSIDADKAITFAKRFDIIELWKVISRNRNLSFSRLIECVEKIEPLTSYSPEFWNMVISHRNCSLSYAIHKAIELNHKSCTKELSKRKDLREYIASGNLNEVFSVIKKLNVSDFRDWFVGRDDITLPIAYWYMSQGSSLSGYLQRYVNHFEPRIDLIEFAKENHDFNFIKAIALRDDMSVIEAINFVRLYYRGNTWQMVQNKKGIYDYFKTKRIKDIKNLLNSSPGDSIEQMMLKYIGGSSYEILRHAASLDSDIVWGVIISRNDFIEKYLKSNNIKKLASILKDTKSSGVVWFTILARPDVDLSYFINLAKETGAPGLCQALEWKLKK